MMLPSGYVPAFGGYYADWREVEERKKRAKQRVMNDPRYDPRFHIVYEGPGTDYRKVNDMADCPSCAAPSVIGTRYGSLGPWDAVTTEGAFVGGRKVVGMTQSGSTAYTFDPASGMLWGNVWDETAGGWRSWQIPTTIAARGQGGPIATAPTGWGRVFPAPEDESGNQSTFGLGNINPMWLVGLIGLGLVGYYFYKNR